MLTTIHVLAVGYAIGVIFFADKEMYDWIRGRKDVLNRELMGKYHLLAWAGIAAVALSGITLLYPKRLYLLSNPLFIAKLLFFVMVCINGLLIGRLIPIVIEKSFKNTSKKEKIHLFASGAVSVIGWVAALMISFIIFS